MARLAIKWASETDLLSKYPAVEKKFNENCRVNNLQKHEIKLARAMLNYSVWCQENQGDNVLDGVKKAFAFTTGFAGSLGMTNESMLSIIKS